MRLTVDPGDGPNFPSAKRSFGTAGVFEGLSPKRSQTVKLHRHDGRPQQPYRRGDPLAASDYIRYRRAQKLSLTIINP